MKYKNHLIENCPEMLPDGSEQILQDGPSVVDPGDEVLLRADEVEQITTLDRKTIMRMVARDTFPAPVQLSERRVAWKRGDVRDFVANPERWLAF